MSDLIDTPPTPPSGPTAGAMLKAAREKLGMPIELLSASLKVSVRQLQMLESDRLDQLPGASFTRSLALTMCRVLKIDAEPVLARLPLPADQTLESVSMGLNKPFKDHGGLGSGGSVLDLLNGQVLGALLLVAAAAAVYWWPGKLWSPGGEGGGDKLMAAASTQGVGPGTTAGASPATTSGEAPRAADSDSAPSTVGTTAPPGGTPGQANHMPTDSAASAKPAGAVPADGAASSAADKPTLAPATVADGPIDGMLMLRTAAESWVEVRDGGGRILLSRILGPGEAAGLDGSLPLRVVVGNAEATQVTFRGQPISLAATRDNVARLELK